MQHESRGQNQRQQQPPLTTDSKSLLPRSVVVVTGVQPSSTMLPAFNLGVGVHASVHFKSHWEKKRRVTFTGTEVQRQLLLARLLSSSKLSLTLKFTAQQRKLIALQTSDYSCGKNASSGTWLAVNPPQSYAATRSGVSASTASRVVCTFCSQVSSRSRRAVIWGIPRTRGWTHDTRTVPSTWSITPSIRWTWKIHIQELGPSIVARSKTLKKCTEQHQSIMFKMTSRFGQLRSYR